MGMAMCKRRGSLKIARYVKFNEIDLNKDGEIDALEASQIKSQVEGARERIDLRRDDEEEWYFSTNLNYWEIGQLE